MPKNNKRKRSKSRMEVDGETPRKKGVSKRTAMELEKKKQNSAPSSRSETSGEEGWSFGPIPETNSQPKTEKEKSLQLRGLIGVGIVKSTKKRQLTRKQKLRKEKRIARGIAFSAHLEKKRDIYKFKGELKRLRKQ